MKKEGKIFFYLKKEPAQDLRESWGVEIPQEFLIHPEQELLTTYEALAEINRDSDELDQIRSEGYQPNSLSELYLAVKDGTIKEYRIDHMDQWWT